MKKIIILVSFFISFYTYSQIAIGKKTFNPHAQLDVTGTQKGVLIPRVTLKDLKSPDPFDTGVNPLPESLLVYNIGGEHAIDSGYYYWSNEQWNKLVIKDELGEVIPDGKDLSSKELSITPDGKGAVLKDIELSIKDKAVTPAKFEPGDEAYQILTTNKNNTVAWEAPAPLDILSKDLTSEHLEITNAGKGAVLKETKLTIKKNIINTAMLEDKAVTTDKIKSGTANQILTTTAKKEVIWADLDKVVGKNITSTHLNITNKGEGAVLKDITIAIKSSVIENAMLKDNTVTAVKVKPGKANQILTTNDKKGVIWADPGIITIRNRLESEGEGENIMRSTVNDIDGETKIVKEVKNTLGTATKSGYPLTTSVNGVSAAVINIHEPWNVSKSDIKATGNAQNIYQMGNVGIKSPYMVDMKDYSLTVTGKVSFRGLPETEKAEKYLIILGDYMGGLEKIEVADLTPKGSIVMWSGAEKTIPKGWAICDGKNKTPNLINRFVVGAGEKYKLGDTGGLDRVKLTVDEMPQHNHEYIKETIQNVYYDYKNYDQFYAVYYLWEEPTGSAGGDESHENRPPYYTLYYIMKL